MKNRIDFNTDWRFYKTAVVPAVLPEAWEQVTLPHTWNAADGQDGGNDYWRGTAMYCKAFTKPELEERGRAVLEFQGAAMTADVYVNGLHLAHHEGGYSTFRVDITEALREENLLCVAVDNGENDRVYPQKADFTFYGGLYRSVALYTLSESHFSLIKDGTNGIKVTPAVKGGDALVTVEVWAEGPADRVRVEVAGQTLEAELQSEAAEMVFPIKDVHLWDGTADPYLYTAFATLYEGAEAKDSVSVRFGCRTVAFDPEQGFLLNGRSYPLRGVSRHQDRAGVGNALTPEMHREDMEIIKEIGANTVRLAHYQHAQEFYDLCDENGLIVWAEIPYITQHMKNGRENTLQQMRELITQCYNHPSIVCWCLSNEITASGVADEDLMENHRLLNDLCHRMDPARPTTMAHVFMLETDSPLIQIADIGSYNLYFGWYLGELEQNDSFFDEYHKKFPGRVIGFSEYGADANPQFQSGSPERGDYSEGYQCVYHEHILDCIEVRPYLWATHVWNLFDFAADGRDEGGKHGVNQKGLVTMDRKLKKDAFYLYKAAWSREPFVHLCGSRYADRAEAVTQIKVYSNLPRVALYKDGELAGEQEGKRVFVFEVPVSGEHTLRAVACRGMENDMGSRTGSTTENSVGSRTGSTMKNSAEDTAESRTGSAMENSAESPAESRIESTTGNGAESRAESTMESTVGSGIRSTMENSAESPAESRIGSTTGNGAGSRTGSTMENSVESTAENGTGSAGALCEDTMVIRKVEAPNPAYSYAQEGGIVNWFDKEDFREGYFSVRDTLGALMAHPKAGAIVGKLMEQAAASRGDVAKSTAGNKNLEKMMAGMSLQSLLKQAGDAVKPEQVKALNAELQRIPKTTEKGESSI